MRISQLMALAGVAAALSLGASQSLAQQSNDQAGRQGGPGQGRQGGRGNFDPAQFQQQMMERTKERLEITDEAEWKAIQPLVQKVMDARRAVEGDRMRGMFGRMRGGPGGPGGDNAQSDQGGRRGGMFGQASAESEALQKAIDSKASNSEMKAALAKFAEARKAKQADLDKAQAELRKVLSVRQEAIATYYGLL